MRTEVPVLSTVASGQFREAPVRYILDLHHSAEGAYGEITREGSDHPEPFTSWLELLRLLEPADQGNQDAAVDPSLDD
jgi:hypothetical protein